MSIREKYIFQPRTNPDRIKALDAKGKWLATFTIGTYTVRLTGPRRTFRERWKEDGSQKEVSVTHNIWVRTLPIPFHGNVDTQQSGDCKIT